MDIWPQRERFKDAVKTYRLANGLRLKDVAGQIGLEESTLKDYLYRKDVRPSLDVLQKSAATFGITIMEFLDEPVPGDMSTVPALGERARFMKRVMGSDLGAMSETEREAAFQAWKAIVEAFRAR